MAATATARVIFLIAPTALAPQPKLAPPAPSAPPQVYPIAWRTCAPTPAPQILNAPPPHLIVKAVLAEQPNPALSTPTAPAQFLIATVALVGRIAPQIRSAQVINPIVALAHASNVPQIPNAPAAHRIAKTTHAPTCYIQQV